MHDGHFYPPRLTCPIPLISHISSFIPPSHFVNIFKHICLFCFSGSPSWLPAHLGPTNHTCTSVFVRYDRSYFILILPYTIIRTYLLLFHLVVSPAHSRHTCLSHQSLLSSLSLSFHLVKLFPHPNSTFFPSLRHFDLSSILYSLPSTQSMRTSVPPVTLFYTFLFYV